MMERGLSKKKLECSIVHMLGYLDWEEIENFHDIDFYPDLISAQVVLIYNLLLVEDQHNNPHIIIVESID